MAVVLQGSSESHTGSTGSTSETSFSWTHLIPAAPKGVLVYTFTNANADDATAVSFGGTSLAAVSGGRAVDAAGEPGDCKTWFLGSGVPFTAGSPNISICAKVLLGSGTWRGLAYGNGTWVVGDTGGNIYCSSSSAPVRTSTWAAASSPGFAGARVLDLAYGANYFVAVGDAGVIRYATDPTGTWSAASAPGFSTSNVNHVAYDGSTYWVATGDGGKIRYATDPTGTWSAATSPGFATTNVWGIAYGNGYWVAGADGGKLRYATDPTGTWSAPTSFTSTANIFRIAYANGYWVAVGSGGEILYATDPTGTWSSATSNSTAVFWGVTYADGYWVAGAADGSVRYKATNPTGSWSSATTPSGNSAEAVGNVLYANGQWLVGGRFCLLVPGSNPTITVTRNNNANEMYAVAITVEADYDVKATGVVLLEGDGTLSEQSVDDGSPGTNSLRFAGINSGLANIVTGTPSSNDLAAGSSSTWTQNIDYGTRVAGVVYETTAGQGGRNVGFAATTSDDRAAVHLAICEAIVPWTVGVPIR